MAETERAFHWIIGALERHNVPYQITGGFAARCYGAARDLADIDIDIPFDQAAEFFQEIRDWLPSAPVHLQDENWDLVYYTLNYEGQEIDLSDTARTFMRGGIDKDWTQYHADFSRSAPHIVYGRNVFLVPKDQLISYKRILNRDVDRADIAQLLA